MSAPRPLVDQLFRPVSELFPPKPSKKPRTRRTPRESAIQDAILEALKQEKKLDRCLYVERRNTMNVAMEDGNGRTRRVASGRRGVGDILVVAHGFAIALEVKRPGEKQRPSQVKWQAKWEQGGGRYFVVTSVDEALAAVRSVRGGR